MTEVVDEDTGEVKPNGIGQRAATAAAQAHVAMKNQLNGLHASSLHFAIWQSLQQMPVWITMDADLSVTRTGPKVRYATLKAMLTVVRPILLANGVRIRQGAERTFSTDDGGGMKGRLVPVYTDLIHIPTGEFERTQIEIPLMKMDPQAMGSAITYGRRYTLIAALGLATDEADDDGESAKPKEMGDRQGDSTEVVALKADMDKQKDIDALTKWASAPANRARLNKLNDVETERIQTHYASVREKLSNAE